MWIFIAVVVVRRAVDPAGAARTAIDWIGLAALSWWAVDEVVRGVNPWRRLLGVAGCVVAARGVATLLR